MERKSVTVNGKNLLQLEEEFCKDFPKSEEKRSENGDLYFEIDSYEKRLNEVVGILNYNILCSEVKIDEVCGSSVISVNMTIEIYSDDNEVVLRKSACGGCNVVIVNATGKPQSLKSNIDSATSEAYKNVCKKFGIGIGQMRSFKKEKKEGKQNGRVGNNIADRAASSVNEGIYRVRFKGKLNSGNRMFQGDVVDTETGEELKFILFETEYDEIRKAMPLERFVQGCRMDTEVTFYGERKQFRGAEQIVFKRLAVG